MTCSKASFVDMLAPLRSLCKDGRVPVDARWQSYKAVRKKWSTSVYSLDITQECVHTINKFYCQVTAQLDAKSLAQQRQRVVHCKPINAQYSQEQWDIVPDVGLSSCNGLVVIGIPLHIHPLVLPLQRA